MEGLMQYWPFWVLYFVFALLGFWCWKQLFFWLPKHSEWRRFWMVPGAVILFTPAPVAAGSTHFAPAVFVLLLDLLSGHSPFAGPAILWLLAGFCVGMLVLAIRHGLTLLRRSGQQEQ